MTTKHQRDVSRLLAILDEAVLIPVNNPDDAPDSEQPQPSYQLSGRQMYELKTTLINMDARTGRRDPSTRTR